MDRTLTSLPILAILLKKILQEPSERKVQQSISPGHCAELQSVTSVELPSQSWRPGWWQARALIFRPLPQELVHVDQSPHSCQPDGATTRISNGESVSIWHKMAYVIPSYHYEPGWQNLAAFRREQKWQWKFSSAYLQFLRQMRRFCA